MSCFLVRQNQFDAFISTFSEKTVKNRIFVRTPSIPAIARVSLFVIFNQIQLILFKHAE